jgi:hypothetical protein
LIANGNQPFEGKAQEKPVTKLMKTPKNLMLAVAILATGMVSSASASVHGESTYYDIIRPNGHPRSEAIYDAAVNACYSSSGESRMAVYDTPAFKQCMLSRGYRFKFTKVIQDPPSVASRSVAQKSYSGPSVTISIGGGYDDEDEANAAAEAANEAALRASQDATDLTNAGIAQTVQGINGP